MDDLTKTELKEPWPDQEARPDIFVPTARRRRWPKLIAGVLVVLLLIAGVAWWLRESTPPARPTRGAIPPAATAVVQTGDINVTINALGTVTSLATVTVKSQISGQLVRVAFQEGQMVKKGDALADIDDRPYQLALAQAQGTLKRDQALLDDAQIDLERYKKLAQTNAIPRQQLDTQVYLVQQDQGNVISDQAQIDTQKLNIAYCHIVSPVDGRVGLRQVDQGNYVTPADVNGIVVVTQLSPISVIFTTAEDNLPSVIKQVQAGKTLSVTAFDRSGNTKLATGTLMTLDNQIDTTTGTLKLRAQFDNQDGSLFPNQFVNIELLVDVLHDTVVVPTSAIQRGAPGTFVYVVDADSTVKVTKVELGPVNGDRVAVRSGLAAGDQVVVDGADKLRDGIKIVVHNPANDATPASAPTPPRKRAPRNQ